MDQDRSQTGPEAGVLGRPTRKSRVKSLLHSRSVGTLLAEEGLVVVPLAAERGSPRWPSRRASQAAARAARPAMRWPHTPALCEA